MSDTGKIIALAKAVGARPDPDDVKQNVEDWLDDHPEATTTVQDGSITKAKLNASLQETVDDVDELKSAIHEYEYRNLFVWANVEANKLLNLNDGKLIAASGYYTSEFIPVKPNTLYTEYLNNQGYEYSAPNENSGVQRITTTEITTNAITFTTSANTHYIRIRVNAADETNGFYLVEGGANFDPQTIKGIHGTIIDETTSIVPHTINALDALSGLPVGNYYNENAGTDTAGSYIRASDGKAVSGTGVSVTDYIPIEPGKTYNVGNFYIGTDQYAFYDRNKGVLNDAHVKTITDNYNGTITAPANARYVRLTFKNTSSNRFISQKYKDHMPYGLSFGGDDDKWLGKKVLVLGDSISDNTYHHESVSEWAKWPYILRAQKGFDLTNDSVKSTGFLAVQSGQNNSLIYRVDEYTTDVYDMVIIFAGINDLLQHVTLGDNIGDDKTADFKSAVEYTLRHVMTYQPSARLLGIIPLPSAGLHDYDDYSRYLWERYRYYNIPILDLRMEGGFHPDIDAFREMFTEKGGNNLPDGLHPNQLWDNHYLAPMIGHFMDKFVM